MNLDLTNFMVHDDSDFFIDGDVLIPFELIHQSNIRKLLNLKFRGKIVKLCDDGYQISGILSGIMVLPDDLTLEDVPYSFDSTLEAKFGSEVENTEDIPLQIIHYHLDITEFLWQNILLEIPSKVKLEKNKDLTLEGNGWSLVTDEELSNSNQNPFEELNQIFSRKE